MSQSRPRVKFTTKRPRGVDVSSSSAEGGRRYHDDPYYSPIIQEARMANFQGRKQTYIRYADMTWMVEQGFEFPHGLESQGATKFLELKGRIYPSLIREFYSNFRCKEGIYTSMILGKLIVLNEELFLDVGGLSSDGSLLGDSNNEFWNSFNAIEMYKSCLRGPHLYVQSELTKAGSLSVENRLLHYLVVYILVQRNTNHAQPTINDLKLMFAIREGIMINWPAEILKVMNGIASSSSRLLAYGIFISRVIDYLEIDTLDTDVIVTNSREHLVGDNLIHKMSIYKFENIWMYQDDHNTNVNVDLSDEEEPANSSKPNPEQPQAEADDVPQEPSFGLAHLDAMEQRLNARIDGHFQSLKNLMLDEFRLQRKMTTMDVDRILFIMRTINGYSPQPPPTQD